MIIDDPSILFWGFAAALAAIPAMVAAHRICPQAIQVPTQPQPLQINLTRVTIINGVAIPRDLAHEAAVAAG